MMASGFGVKSQKSQGLARADMMERAHLPERVASWLPGDGILDEVPGQAAATRLEPVKGLAETADAGIADHDHEGLASTTGSSTATSLDGSSLSLEETLTVLKTGDQGIDGLLKGVCWADGAITYCDPDSVTDYEANYPKPLVETEISQLSAQQLGSMHFALNADPTGVYGAASGFSVEGFTGLSVSYSGAGTGSGTIAVINRSSTPTASGYYPSLASYGGDVFFGGSGETPIIGNYDWATVLHELGHALGLKHGQDTSVYGALPYALDSMEYSVMTYRSYVGATGGYSNEQWGYAQTYMMYDVAALQHMYGVDYSTKAGNTVYCWKPGSGDTLIDGQVAIHPGANRIFLTIWDGGGNDTYDLSAYTSGVKIDLNPGRHSLFSTTQLADLDQYSTDPSHTARGNVFNALLHKGNTASLIENATGGSGSDTITGNQASNHLSGGRGNDILQAGAGGDVLTGGLGRDALYGGTDAMGDDFVFGSRYDSVAGSGRDTIHNFTRGADDIDLRGIDARSGTTGVNDAFTYSGKTAQAYSVWWSATSSGVLLRADVTGDRKADIEILLKGATAFGSDDLFL